MTADSTINPRAGYAGWVAPLCWTAVALEGFDLVVLGVVLPALLQEPTWGLTPNTASLVSVVGLVGVMIGAMLVGAISDVIGRRQTVVWTVVVFSILTLACAFAPNPFVFGLLRFLAGLGLGGVLPTAIAMINEFAAHRSGRSGDDHDDDRLPRRGGGHGVAGHPAHPAGGAGSRCSSSVRCRRWCWSRCC